MSHHHMLRHACGYALARISTTQRRYERTFGTVIFSTGRYTELSPILFKNFWRE
jgi:hypothetical protein